MLIVNPNKRGSSNDLIKLITKSLMKSKIFQNFKKILKSIYMIKIICHWSVIFLVFQV